jgi:hypothetical protein
LIIAEVWFSASLKRNGEYCWTGTVATDVELEPKSQTRISEIFPEGIVPGKETGSPWTIVNELVFSIGHCTGAGVAMGGVVIVMGRVIVSLVFPAGLPAGDGETHPVARRNSTIRSADTDRKRDRCDIACTSSQSIKRTRFFRVLYYLYFRNNAGFSRRIHQRRTINPPPVKTPIPAIPAITETTGTPPDDEPVPEEAAGAGADDDEPGDPGCCVPAAGCFGTG